MRLSDANRRVWLLSAGVLWMATVVGCGNSDLGTVTGTVHLDGQPLADAVVTFYPQGVDPAAGGGGASYGRTDETGAYELQYQRRRNRQAHGRDHDTARRRR